MERPRRAALVVGLVLLVGAAGCLWGEPRSDASSPSPSSTPEPIADRANCSDDLRVSFWGLNEPGLWNAKEVRFSTNVPPNTSLLYVAYVDGTVGGVRSASTTADGGFHADGESVGIDEDLAGEHGVRIVVHRDVDDDGALDQEADPPCYSDDGPVQTEYIVIDFDRYW